MFSTKRISLKSIDWLQVIESANVEFFITDRRSKNYASLLGEKNISIHGSIKFDIKPGKLPKPSCMKIFLEDISLQDVNSVLYHESQYDLSGKTLEETFEYSLKTRKPRDMKYTYYSLSVVLNVGWCPDKNSKLWVRNNDYLSDVTVKVQLEEDQHDYEINVPAVYYCKSSSSNQYSTKWVIMILNQRSIMTVNKIMILFHILLANSFRQRPSRYYINSVVLIVQVITIYILHLIPGVPKGLQIWIDPAMWI